MTVMPVKVRAAFDQWYGQADEAVDGQRTYLNGARWYIQTYGLANTPSNLSYTIKRISAMSKRFRWHDLARWRDWRRQEMADKEASKAIAKVKKELAERGLRAQTIAMESLERLHANGSIGATAASMLLKIGIGAQLRGYDLPESIQRQEVTGKDGNTITVDHVLQLLPPHLREEAIALARQRLSQGNDSNVKELTSGSDESFDDGDDDDNSEEGDIERVDGVENTGEGVVEGEFVEMGNDELREDNQLDG